MIKKITKYGSYKYWILDGIFFTHIFFLNIQNWGVVIDSLSLIGFPAVFAYIFRPTKLSRDIKKYKIRSIREKLKLSGEEHLLFTQKPRATWFMDCGPSVGKNYFDFFDLSKRKRGSPKWDLEYRRLQLIEEQNRRKIYGFRSLGYTEDTIQDFSQTYFLQSKWDAEITRVNFNTATLGIRIQRLLKALQDNFPEYFDKENYFKRLWAKYNLLERIFVVEDVRLSHSHGFKEMIPKRFWKGKKYYYFPSLEKPLSTLRVGGDLKYVKPFEEGLKDLYLFVTNPKKLMNIVNVLATFIVYILLLPTLIGNFFVSTYFYYGLVVLLSYFKICLYMNKVLPDFFETKKSVFKFSVSSFFSFLVFFLLFRSFRGFLFFLTYRFLTIDVFFFQLKLCDINEKHIRLFLFLCGKLFMLAVVGHSFYNIFSGKLFISNKNWSKSIYKLVKSENKFIVLVLAAINLVINLCGLVFYLFAWFGSYHRLTTNFVIGAWAWDNSATQVLSNQTTIKLFQQLVDPISWRYNNRNEGYPPFIEFFTSNIGDFFSYSKYSGI